MEAIKEVKFLLIKTGDIKTSNRFSINAPLNQPPLGLLYIGAMLESDGHNVEILDYYMENITREKLEKYLLSSDAVGMTVLTDDYKAAAEISKMIKEIDPNIPIIIGGPHCTFLQKRSLKDIPYADICVVGEGEYVILDLVKYFKGEKKLADIHGIHYRNNGTINSGKQLKVINNLDDLPFPARHLVDKYDYGNFSCGYKFKKRVTALVSSRGCPFHCRFCTRYSNVIKEWGFRQRSAENVAKEIQELDGRYRTALIVDDNFLADNKRAHKILDMLLEKGNNVELMIEGARVDSANRELYQKMKKANVKYIGYGIESGNQDVLDFYRKNFTIKQVKEAVSLAREMNFFINATFILGAPIETEQHIKNTIKFACSLPIDVASFIPLRYLMGSQLWNEAVENKKISNDTYAVTADSNKGLGNFPFEELTKYTNQAFKAFYFRPSYLMSEIYRSILRNDYSLLLNGWKFLFSI
jgi:radical SAM superfamily enzyme YgiQ (UPF0313 family)